METVGKIGRYISKGAYIVSGPFHPFGGAIDIIVVEQPDGTFKSSPWYVRFGKFQGVLKTKEKIVKLCVNGVEADINMYLNHKGEAYFIQEVEEEDTDWKPQGGGGRRNFKSKSFNFDTSRNHMKARSYSRSSQTCLSCYGRSFGDDFDEEGEFGPDVIKRDPMDRAEIVAELLEFKWSTNLYSRRRLKQLKKAGVDGSVDNSDVIVPEIGDGEKEVSLHSHRSSEDRKPRELNVCSRESGPTVGSVSSEEKSQTDQSQTSSDTSSSFLSRSECSIKSASGIVSPPETPQVDREDVIRETNEGKLSEVEPLLQTVETCSSSQDHASRDGESVIMNNTGTPSPPLLPSGSSNGGVGSCNVRGPANGKSKGQTDMTVRFHLSSNKESTQRVLGQAGENVLDASPLGGAQSSHEQSPSHSTSDESPRNVRSPRRNTTARIMNGMKRVKSVPDMVSRLKSKSKHSLPHSRSQSLDFNAPLAGSSLSDSPRDGRGSLSNPSSPDSSHMNGSETIRPRLARKMVRVFKPTSNQLASLNLKEGSNIATFLFYTSMLGKQQVEARIYLWKWNSRVIISDVDGTITKSDVLGQFMPLMGMDWSHVGVANLYSAIKENGYHMLFLSARAITQACLTRRFLINLNQNGKVLPDGPIVISPDGLFPSLYREVIIRKPHEFKIGCLEEIKSLFPSDCNPFYAGFGNRDTDEISYLKVGIPKGKIFIINPKGEVVVNRHVDTKSYTSLHSLVHGMFPPTNKAEQEDFNNWNFWKMPLPPVDM
ncbi:hypothetical protein MLD38_012950 [Melastoma candidum]|uniref:Uncharacterized protein n=1 Tax=Melastoma candidum TaxID=119954 RepID=A0ACB9R998_9MYRT|nr:hypothetical protein MLD38_012950 [Melastoma candidum]